MRFLSFKRLYSVKRDFSLSSTNTPKHILHTLLHDRIQLVRHAGPLVPPHFEVQHHHVLLVVHQHAVAIAHVMHLHQRRPVRSHDVLPPSLARDLRRAQRADLADVALEPPHVVGVVAAGVERVEHLR